MRAITEEVRTMPLAFMSARILSGSGLLASGAKSFIDESLQPATPMAAIRTPVRASLANIGAATSLLSGQRLSARPGPQAEHQWTVSPLTLKIPYRKPSSQI